jgi:hypothetical protein
LRGRSVILLSLFTLVVVGWIIIWRRSYGYTESTVVRGMERRLASLAAERVKLEGDIRDASSRARLGGVAETKLGMRVPADTQVVIMPRRKPNETP